MKPSSFIALLLVSVFLVSCQSVPKTVDQSYPVGKYTIDPPGYGQIAWAMLRHLSRVAWSGNGKLEIRSDSTFQVTGCNVITGKWTTLGDTVYLHCELNRSRNDSLYAARGPMSCGTGPRKLLRKGNQLQDLERGVDPSGKYWIFKEAWKRVEE